MKAALRKILLHPCVVACELGLIAMVISLQLPEPIISTIESIGKCNTPLTMLLIGMILSEINLRSLVDKTIAQFTLHRLIIMPLVVYLACRILKMDHIVTGVSTLLTAMPAGAMTPMMAAKYNRDPQFATKLVIFSTLGSIPTIFAWSLLLS